MCLIYTKGGRVRETWCCMYVCMYVCVMRVTSSRRFCFTFPHKITITITIHNNLPEFHAGPFLSPLDPCISFYPSLSTFCFYGLISPCSSHTMRKTPVNLSHVIFIICSNLTHPPLPNSLLK